VPTTAIPACSPSPTAAASSRLSRRDDGDVERILTAGVLPGATRQPYAPPAIGETKPTARLHGKRIWRRARRRYCRLQEQREVRLPTTWRFGETKPPRKRAYPSGWNDKTNRPYFLTINQLLMRKRVMAGLVPAISKIGAQRPPQRDRRDKPGDDECAATTFAPLTALESAATFAPLIKRPRPENSRRRHVLVDLLAEQLGEL
jgi:hypothetical protein